MPHRAALAMLILKAIDEASGQNLKEKQLQIETTLNCGTKVVVTVNVDGKKKKTSLKIVKPDAS